MTLHDLLMIGAGVVLTSIGNWLLRIFDVIVPFSKAPNKLRTTLSVKANRSLFWTSVLMLFEIVSIVLFAIDKSPATWLSILYGAMLVACSFFFFSWFLWELQSVSRERRRVKAAENAKIPQ